MTKAQYKILCRMRSRVTKARREYDRLSKINEDPDNQFDWDAMKVAEGRWSGLSYGLSVLTLALKASDVVAKGDE